jgi:hypothetical protein
MAGTVRNEKPSTVQAASLTIPVKGFNSVTLRAYQLVPGDASDKRM